MAGTEDTEELLARVARGEREARGELLQRHWDRLRQMIALRLDRRLAARVDPSDVLLESLGEADRKLDDYARDRPIPFYPWLRQIAWDLLVRAHRRHLHAQARSVRAEGPALSGLPDSSDNLLADRLAAPGAGPDVALEHEEQRQRLCAGLALLGQADREVLVLRYLEDMATREIAAVLGLTESAVKMRQLRALQRLRVLLGEEEGTP